MAIEKVLLYNNTSIIQDEVILKCMHISCHALCIAGVSSSVRAHSYIS